MNIRCNRMLWLGAALRLLDSDHCVEVSRFQTSSLKSAGGRVFGGSRGPDTFIVEWSGGGARSPNQEPKARPPPDVLHELIEDLVGPL